MPVENPTIIIKDDAEDSDDGNTVANNSQPLIRHTRSLRSSHRAAQSQQSAVSKQVPIHQLQTAESRKRIHAESEDDLAAPAKHPRTRTFSAAEVENWETVLIEEFSRIDPETVRSLLDSSKSESRRQRGRIAQLTAQVIKEREVHKGFEKHQNEKYAALEKEYRALKRKMAEILTANVEAFGLKVSDETIIGEWHQLYFKVQNLISNYSTNASPSRASTNRMIFMSDIISRRQLWTIICFHCFSGLTGHRYEGIGQMLAHDINQIDPRAPPSRQYLKMISNMKSAFDPNIREDERLSDSSEAHQAITDAMPCFEDGMLQEQKEAFKRDFGEIIQQAANLHDSMMKSKAIFVVKWAGNHNGEDGCIYDPETMISWQDGIDTASSNYVVDLYESPAVWKIGNADGENFDSVMVLCKSVVAVKEKKRAVLTTCQTS